MPLRKLLLWLLVASAFVFLFAGATSSRPRVRAEGESIGVAGSWWTRPRLPEAGRVSFVIGDAAAGLPPLSPFEWWIQGAYR
jgi:hypothetical protein